MYKICKTEQSALRQRELEMLLLKELQLRHFDDISIIDLCDGAGIPRKAFYRYFSSKRGALHALLDHTLMDCQSLELHTNVRASVDHQLGLFFRFWQKQKPFLDALERSALWEELGNRMLEFVQTELVQSQHFSQPYTEDICAVHFAIGGVVTVLRTWYRNGFDTPADKLAAALSQAIRNGLPLR